MLVVIAAINAVIFFALSGLHLFWASGGRWSKMEALPSKKNSTEKLFMPSLFSTLVVAAGLFLFAPIAIGATGFFYSIIEPQYFLWANFVIGVIFLARAVGDFRYLGFFKLVKDTTFARNDTKYYAPLCALLSLDSFLIFVLG